MSKRALALRWGLLVAAFAAVGILLTAAHRVPAGISDGSSAGSIASASFEQLDVSVDGGRHFVENSDWLSLALTFVGDPRILYLNLSANGVWAIQNIPVQSVEGDHELQAMSYAFGVGTEPGQPLESMTFGMSLTDEVLHRPPGETDVASVGHGQFITASCELGSSLSLAGARPLVGGQAAPLKKGDEAKKHVNDKNFPNQEADISACAPVAFSNSLQWLNATHGLGLKAEEISIGAMKTATKFEEGKGAPADSYKDKDKATNKLGIVTKAEKNPDSAAKALDEDCDVELDVNGHIAAVVGIQKLADGKYAVDVAHDTDQGKPGGTKTETTTFNPATNKFSGGTLDGRTLDQFVVECPEKKKKK